MISAFSILIVLALASVLGVLILGLVSMVRGCEVSQKYGNRLMQLRVGLQALAVVLIVIAALLSGR